MISRGGTGKHQVKRRKGQTTIEPLPPFVSVYQSVSFPIDLSSPTFYHQSSTTNHPSPTILHQQPSFTTNHPSPPTILHHQPSFTNHPPLTSLHKPSFTNHLPPPPTILHHQPQHPVSTTTPLP
ncbi:hypothetical protein Pmani_005714 [Petrolisthes manimaculis]|uniref:Uncharacterized protein n=1 Tax=Petrolisthes manimaculis TaxID=1843537 RepID=A0AAE1UMM0_9EUCA|nr:hypothetical protein Pmani_005714 [Petrolisthes manimaculis]